MAHRWKSVILAIFLHSKHQKSYQGSLGTKEMPPTGSMPSHGRSLGLTGLFKRTLWFSRFCKALFTFYNKTIDLVFLFTHRRKSHYSQIISCPDLFSRSLWFLRFRKAGFTFSKKNTFSKPSEYYGTCLWSLLYFTKVQGTLIEFYVPLNGP